MIREGRLKPLEELVCWGEMMMSESFDGLTGAFYWWIIASVFWDEREVGRGLGNRDILF